MRIVITVLAAEGLRRATEYDIPQGLKPTSPAAVDGTAEAVPFQTKRSIRSL
jgi:hypothetical protein